MTGQSKQMTIEQTRLTPVFAAEIGGVDLSWPLDDATFDAIARAAAEYAVLLFRDQRLSDQQQVDFTERFGPLEVPLPRDQYGGVHGQVTRLSNVGDGDKLLAADDEHATYMKGNQLWHIDSSFKPVPAMYSILSGREVPPEGGETEFADARAAYDAWPEETDGIAKAELDNCVCEHSIVYSRSLIVGDIFSDAEKRAMPPVRQKLIRTHPVTGRKSFYVGSHASHILGWDTDESRALLRRINEWCVQDRFVYSHKWRAGDLVIWDNRSVMHRGKPWDPQHRRVMHRTTVSDVDAGVTEVQVA